MPTVVRMNTVRRQSHDRLYTPTVVRMNTVTYSDHTLLHGGFTHNSELSCMHSMIALMDQCMIPMATKPNTAL